MPVVALLSCEVLGAELAHVLSGDPDLAGVLVVDNGRADGFCRGLELAGRIAVEHIARLPAARTDPGPGLQVVAKFLDLTLHRDRALLQRTLLRELRALAPHADVVLCVYTRCAGLAADFAEVADVSVPVVLPADTDGEPCDDCVALLMGGSQEYRAVRREDAATFFLTPGWCEHWRRLQAGVNAETGRRAVSSCFRNYRRLLLVPNPAADEQEMRDRSAELQVLTGLPVANHPGSLRLLEQAWQNARLQAAARQPLPQP